MMRVSLFLLFSLSQHLAVTSFTAQSVVRFASRLAALPTVDDVVKDDFMKQLGHASNLIPLLHSKTQEVPAPELLNVLQKQLSHSDGIRGFFAVYLTSPESLEDEVPEVLAEAVRRADPKVMVPLACMNVVMPTAMTIIHQDPELKECAAKTAENGKKILRLIKGTDLVIDNCMAIDRVCAELDGDDELYMYWNKFFENYKYGDDEKEAIGLAVAEFC